MGRSCDLNFRRELLLASTMPRLKDVNVTSQRFDDLTKFYTNLSFIGGKIGGPEHKKEKSKKVSKNTKQKLNQCTYLFPHFATSCVPDGSRKFA